MMCINFFNLAFLFTLVGAGKIRVNTTDDQFVLDFRDFRVVVGNMHYVHQKHSVWHIMEKNGKEPFLANTRASYQIINVGATMVAHK
jgi:hypothetical protein